jgi:hypothetical protein
MMGQTTHHYLIFETASGFCGLKTTSTDYETDCLSCHLPAEASDWIFLQGYPLLKQ